MGEYANLTIWRKLESNNLEYHQYYKIFQDRVKAKAFYKELGKEALKFGQLAFKEVEGTIYFSHVPVGRSAEYHQKEWKGDIKKDWLTLFDINEMTITDGVVFEAETIVEKAMERIDAMNVKTIPEWAIFRMDFYCWLKVYAKPGDKLKLSSNFVYCDFYDESSQVNVKEIINEKIDNVKKVVQVPHWGNETF